MGRGQPPLRRCGNLEPFFRVTLSGLPPTVNHLYRTAANGRRYKTRAGRTWQRDAAEILRCAWCREPYGGDVELRVYLVAADRRKWDIDNRVKAVQDCLQAGGVLKDDRQVQRLLLERGFGQYAQTRLELYEWGR